MRYEQKEAAGEQKERWWSWSLLMRRVIVGIHWMWPVRRQRSVPSADLLCFNPIILASHFLFLPYSLFLCPLSLFSYSEQPGRHVLLQSSPAWTDSVSQDAGDVTGNQSVLMAPMRPRRPAVSKTMTLLTSRTLSIPLFWLWCWRGFTFRVLLSKWDKYYPFRRFGTFFWH